MVANGSLAQQELYMQNPLQFISSLTRKEANERVEVEKISERSNEASEEVEPGELL